MPSLDRAEHVIYRVANLGMRKVAPRLTVVATGADRMLPHGVRQITEARSKRTIEPVTRMFFVLIAQILRNEG